ncbi:MULTISPECIES: WXG100 family type VII secretion target [unclassified Streptomyces]|uniref:WXG100 family type VII secretion target n=1 Tax=unclassified Streptomyces TaxID=2593676 RepID=UPI00380FDA70
MADYNGGGFDENHGMVFGSPDGAADGSRDDYDKWDWKQIQAAIVGQASGTPNGDDLARARGVADPQSLADASRVFFEVQQVLEGVSKALTDQANALAGDKGPWRGDAAQSFVNMMTTFSRQVRANADVLSGGSTGLNSVPKQLANNAVALNNAQNLILRINSWYAQEALLQGAATGPDGAVSVSQKPKIVEMMTADMRAVLKSLASDYSVTVDSIATPTPVTVSVNGGDGPGLGGGDGLDGGLGGDPGGGGDIPGLGGDAGLGSDGGGLGPDPQSLAALAGTPDTGGLDSGLDPGGAGGGLDGLGDPAPFPGDTSDLGGGTDGLGLGDDAGIGGGDFDPSGLDNLINPSPFPGLGGLGSGGGLGAGDEAFDGVSAGDPAAFGDTGLGVGAAGGLGDGLGSGLDDGLGSGLGDGLGSGLGDGLGVGEGAAQPATSAGFPYMPGMGGMGGGSAAGAGLSSEPSDASGLLDPSTEPWEGDTSVGDGEVGSELGAAAGGEGLGTAAGAEGQGAAGMPYLPGMGGMGGATGGRDAAAERSDASGLLEPDTEPWEPEETSESEEVGSPEGVLPGVPFLLGFGEAGPVSRPDTARRGTESGAPAEAEATADEPAETAETATATSGAPVMIGSDGLPVAGKEVGDGDAADGGADNGGADGGAVVARPLPGDGEEDFSAWETAAGAAAFVPLLWTLPRQGRTEPGTDEDEDRLAHEPRGTWQPERNAAQSAPPPNAVAPFVSFHDTPAAEPEEAEAEPEGETEESSRGIADLLVQEEGAWGSVPGGAGPSL